MGDENARAGSALKLIFKAGNAKYLAIPPSIISIKSNYVFIYIA